MVNRPWVNLVKFGLTVIICTPAVTENGGDNVGDEEDDREFWNLMKDPAVSEAKMNRAINRMVEARDGCDLSVSSGDLSSRSSPEISPRTRLKQEADVDFTVTSLGCFLDLLLEKVCYILTTVSMLRQLVVKVL